MPADGFCSNSSITRSMFSGDISGSSPCTLTMISARGILRATSATRSVPLAQSGLVITNSPRKRSTSRGDLRMVGGDEHAGRPLGGAGRFVGVLQQCLAGFAQQHLARQPRRGVAGGDDDVTSRHVPIADVSMLRHIVSIGFGEPKHGIARGRLDSFEAAIA